VPVDLYILLVGEITLSQAIKLRVSKLLSKIVRFKVTILSHPPALTKVSLAELLFDVYVIPLVQVKELHAVIDIVSESFVHI
jgi:hypothetical protein